MDENCEVCGKVAPLRIVARERRCPQCRKDWERFIESGGVALKLPEVTGRHLSHEVLAAVIMGLAEQQEAAKA